MRDTSHPSHSPAPAITVLAVALACSGSETEPESGADGPFVSFVDPSSGEGSELVFDVDREAVRFDEVARALVWTNGELVSGWRITGNELAWANSSLTFRVVFGSEDGERRAFFTDAELDTLCDLSLRADGTLSIQGTSQVPPGP